MKIISNTAIHVLQHYIYINKSTTSLVPVIMTLNGNYRLDVYEISSIKIFEKCIKKTPRVVSMYCTGSSPRFWIWLSFFECFGILSASQISIFWVLSSKYFGFNAAEERSLLEICIYSISKFPLFIIRLVHIISNSNLDKCLLADD